MVVVTDSFMGIFTPKDISSRITQFIEKKIEFPFIKKDEIVGIFYLFGKDNKVLSDLEILSVRNIAKRTMEQQARNIKIFHEFKENKLDSELQLIVKNLFEICLLHLLEIRKDLR
jgi:hypothetical protein